MAGIIPVQKNDFSCFEWPDCMCRYPNLTAIERSVMEEIIELSGLFVTTISHPLSAT